jgi:hypothetical protein
MALGSQDEKGSCADLTKAAIKIIKEIKNPSQLCFCNVFGEANIRIK